MLRFLPIVLVLSCTLPLLAQAERYALVLEDPPVAQRFHSADERTSEAGVAYRRRIEKAQQLLRTELEHRQVRVTGATQLLTNYVFVMAPREREAELGALPGVKAVLPLSRKFKTK